MTKGLVEAPRRDEWIGVARAVLESQDARALRSAHHIGVTDCTLVRLRVCWVADLRTPTARQVGPALRQIAEAKAVCRRCPSFDGEPVSWVLSRDQLYAGLEERVGDLDVVIEPMPDVPSRVLVTLAPPRKQAAVFAVLNASLREFLERTYRAVPAGTESSRLDMDAVIAQLLDGAPPGGGA